MHVTSVAVSGPGATAEAIADVTQGTTSIMSLANRHARGPMVPMSVAVNVEKPRDYLAFVHHDGIFFVIWPMLAGMVIGRAKLDVDVAFTSGSRVLHGHGSAAKEGSVYADAQKRALVVALADAIRNAR